MERKLLKWKFQSNHFLVHHLLSTHIYFKHHPSNMFSEFLLFRKRRLLSEESFRCCAVLHWSRLSGRRIMHASRKVPSPSHHILLLIR